MTLERLAEMVAHRFEQTAGKEELVTFEKGVTDRFNRIENILAGGLSNRVEHLEDSVRMLKTKIGIR
ncbi:MAG: hypothetical protein A3B08_01675 [Candidatus Taylorbacteria bacterium RIFCSPLOWO2_01_FULL_43_44]|nr:MAG: hypothetical protein A3B08_01675 [Candidatus Taylorbacteria bacterium RIFCSPLOWO2_01_FULL_43_44]